MPWMILISPSIGPHITLYLMLSTLVSLGKILMTATWTRILLKKYFLSIVLRTRAEKFFGVRLLPSGERVKGVCQRKGANRRLVTNHIQRFYEHVCCAQTAGVFAVCFSSVWAIPLVHLCLLSKQNFFPFSFRRLRFMKYWTGERAKSEVNSAVFFQFALFVKVHPMKLTKAKETATATTITTTTATATTITTTTVTTVTYCLSAKILFDLINRPAYVLKIWKNP